MIEPSRHVPLRSEPWDQGAAVQAIDEIPQVVPLANYDGVVYGRQLTGIDLAGEWRWWVCAPSILAVGRSCKRSPPRARERVTRRVELPAEAYSRVATHREGAGHHRAIVAAYPTDDGIG